MTDSSAPLENALEVEHLSVAFEDTPILADLSFSVPSGTTLAIIGPNGAGKSILLRALIGAVPSLGTVRWAPDTRLGYVPQKLDLERDLPLTGLDLLHAKAEICGSSPADVDDALKLVELREAVANQTIGTLSGGEFQRLLLAFALMGQPTALLVDEPTAGLDEPGIAAVYAVLRRLQVERGLTVLLISHELSVVFEQADNVLCLAHGVTFFGPPIEVLTPENLRQAYGGRVRFHRHADAAN
ncbi:MAG TPA: metal ABC transporter ATP-binding protein [Gemmatimonadaceae bacterium]|nr:metal ABC transporter ATP-binding protein [Gemmatimonadaceae bacterium]